MDAPYVSTAVRLHTQSVQGRAGVGLGYGMGRAAHAYSGVRAGLPLGQGCSTPLLLQRNALEKRWQAHVLKATGTGVHVGSTSLQPPLQPPYLKAGLDNRLCRFQTAPSLASSPLPIRLLPGKNAVPCQGGKQPTNQHSTTLLNKPQHYQPIASAPHPHSHSPQHTHSEVNWC